MERTRLAIACQGGGSQCAFVAGALKRLFERRIQDRYAIVGLSGTSGGAFTAALAWKGLLEEAHGQRTAIGERILACWRDLSAQTPLELIFDKTSTQALRLIEHGLLPSLATSPSAPLFRLWSQGASFLLGRPEFTDLRSLLLKHLAIDSLPSLIQPQSPVLLVGAGDVLEGTFKVFSSALAEINVDALLASAAIPNLFPAVWVDGHAYWDGIFASNPPVVSFLRSAVMGKGVQPPNEIWIIQVNPWLRDSVPETPSDIFDRRNQLAGNLSLRHELQLIELLNYFLQEGALTDAFRARFGFDEKESIKVRFLRMSDRLRAGLDYPSKLSRQAGHIERLIADGEAQAEAFLAELAPASSAVAQTAMVPSPKKTNRSRTEKAT